MMEEGNKRVQEILEKMDERMERMDKDHKEMLERMDDALRFIGTLINCSLIPPLRWDWRIVDD
ncbi:MAG TPA: hypothetical protein PKV21_01710 [bacterium]|nr:hypothetical protein [bacterium]